MGFSISTQGPDTLAKKGKSIRVSPLLFLLSCVLVSAVCFVGILWLLFFLPRSSFCKVTSLNAFATFWWSAILLINKGNIYLVEEIPSQTISDLFKIN